MKEIKVYEAFDGTRFDTESMCKHYEEEHFLSDYIRTAMITIAHFCEGKNCLHCPLYDEPTEDDEFNCYLMHHTPAHWTTRFEK